MSDNNNSEMRAENFRNAVMGFNKEDVLVYIDTLLGQIGEEKTRRQEAEAALEEARRLRSEAEDKAKSDDDRRSEEEKELSEARSQLDSARAELDEYRKSADDAIARAEVAEKKVGEMRAEFEKLKRSEGETNEELARKLAEAEERADAAEAAAKELEGKLRDAKAKLGAAMLDARAFSDELVDRARQKTDLVFDSASERAKEASARADAMQVRLRDIARRNSDSFEEMLGLIGEFNSTLKQFSEDAANGTATAAAARDAASALGRGEDFADDGGSDE